MSKKNNKVPPSLLSNLQKNPSHQPPSFGAKIQLSTSPIPPASEIETLHKLDPEYPKKAISMAEKQQEHRITMEKEILKNNNNIKFRAQLWSGFITLFSLLVAGIFAYLGYPYQALGFGSPVILALALAFSGRKK